MKELIYNLNQDFLRFYRRFVYIFNPVLGLMLYFVANKFLNIEPQSNENFISNVINISGILAGFLFTTISTFSALPSNKFTETLRQSGYFKSIRLVLLIGIISFIFAFVLGIYFPAIEVVNIFFIVGVAETISGAYYFYQITKYTLMSN